MTKSKWRLTALGFSALLTAAAMAAPPEGGEGKGPPANGQKGKRLHDQQAENAGASSRPAGQQGDRPKPDPDKLFDRIDKDGNGSLSREEFKEFIAHRPGPPPREGGEGGGPPPREDGDKPPPKE